ncbi:hypothetical protein EDB92DRAFT_288586 [Lactarius akahatsu]|uniref:Uncharacterized protein n=1 Tax=Lactarius akahatsu TaxID=416441 RepID=A0AAD4QF36_9AGAM|nr:hypothetical protein EDB92DRAFT_288586 [Lactarius akahatsu]
MSTLPKNSESRSSKALSTPGTITSFHLPPPLSLDRRTDWRALPPDASPSPRSHIPSDEEIIEAIAFVWCIHWNSFSTMDAAGLRARILAQRPSWHLLEKRVANVRSRALADGRLRRPAHEVGLRMQPSMDEVRLREHAYDFDPQWRSARRAHVCKLLKSFEITSGEVVWGQLAAFVSGMKSGVRDKGNAALATASSSSPWRFRTAARPGIWHVRKLPTSLRPLLSCLTLTAATATDRACKRGSNTLLPVTADRLPPAPRKRRPHVRPRPCALWRRGCPLRGPPQRRRLGRRGPRRHDPHHRRRRPGGMERPLGAQMADVPRWHMAGQAPRRRGALGASRRAAYAGRVLHRRRARPRGATPYRAVKKNLFVCYSRTLQLDSHPN